MSQLGIAIIGMGMGAAHLRNANAHESARVIAICDLNEKYLGELQREFNVPFATTVYEEILARPDVQIVSIATPDWLHHEMTLAALRAGKHVLVEKPMALNVAQCAEMVTAARRTGLKLMVGHICRFYPFFEQVKRWAEDGTLGTPYYVEITYCKTHRKGEGPAHPLHSLFMRVSPLQATMSRTFPTLARTHCSRRCRNCPGAGTGYSPRTCGSIPGIPSSRTPLRYRPSRSPEASPRPRPPA